MYQMFHHARAFNQPLNNWNVAKVNYMRSVFHAAHAFNQPLNNWNVARVTDMRCMFMGAVPFNQPLDSWDVAQVTDMIFLFGYAYAFNQTLNSWNVSQVIRLDGAFRGAKAFNQPLNSWNVARVTRMDNMFNPAIAFNQNLCNFGDYYDSGKVYSGMFNNSGCDNKATPTSANGPWCQDCTRMESRPLKSAPKLSSLLPNGHECIDDSECESGYCDIESVGHCADSQIHITQETFTSVSFKCLDILLNTLS